MCGATRALEEIFKVVDDCVRKPGELKNIVINFDGTGGEPAWAVQEEDERGVVPKFANEGGMSNVCKLQLYAGGNIDNSNCTFDEQISLYYKGVGTWDNSWYVSSKRAATGAGAMEEIYMRAYKHLEKIHQEGDKLYIFGFSRGAATARLMASYLDHNKINGVTPQIAFLGVFDTVVESSDVGNNEDIKNLDVEGKDSSLPACVERALHLVSLDDRREPFRPTLFNKDERVTEVWCPGNHSDVGGGYYHDGLSDIALECMRREAARAGMKLRDIAEDDCKNHKFTLVGNMNVKNIAEFDKDMKVTPNSLEHDIHDECSAMYRPLNLYKWFTHRTVRVMKDDEGCDDPVLVHEAVLDRMNGYEKDVPYWFQYPPYFRVGYSPYSKSQYAPKNIVGVKHKIVRVSEDGILVEENRSIE